MKIVLRVVAALFAATAVFLIAEVISALSSEGETRTAAAVIYVVIALLLAFLALRFWMGTADDRDS